MSHFAKGLKYILMIENLLGVSRSWSFSDEQTWKGLLCAAFWIVSSMSVTLLIRTYFEYYEHEFSERVINVNSVLSIGNTILTIVWACATSKQFQQLLFHLSKVHSHLEHYTRYIRKSSEPYTVVGVMLIIFLSVNGIGSCFITIMRMKTGFWEVPLDFYWINLVYLACLVRAGVGYLLFYCILKVLSVQLEFIAFDATEITKKLRTRDSEVGEMHEEFVESLDKLSSTYIHACESCGLINTIFSVPTSTSFGLLVMYHIIIAYVLTTQTAIVGMTTHQTMLYAVMLLPNIIALITISVAGQRVHNNAAAITRALAYLLNVTNAEDAFYHVARRAVRAAAARPLRLVIFGCTQIGTALLPTSLAFFTTYLIIALQFNNVL